VSNSGLTTFVLQSKKGDLVKVEVNYGFKTLSEIFDLKKGGLTTLEKIMDYLNNKNLPTLSKVIQYWAKKEENKQDLGTLKFIIDHMTINNLKNLKDLNNSVVGIKDWNLKLSLTNAIKYLENQKLTTLEGIIQSRNTKEQENPINLQFFLKDHQNLNTLQDVIDDWRKEVKSSKSPIDDWKVNNLIILHSAHELQSLIKDQQTSKKLYVWGANNSGIGSYGKLKKVLYPYIYMLPNTDDIYDLLSHPEQCPQLGNEIKLEDTITKEFAVKAKHLGELINNFFDKNEDQSSKALYDYLQKFFKDINKKFKKELKDVDLFDLLRGNIYEANLKFLLNQIEGLKLNCNIYETLLESRLVGQSEFEAKLIEKKKSESIQKEWKNMQYKINFLEPRFLKEFIEECFKQEYKNIKNELRSLI
jgi:hypothetical protein